MFSGPKNKNMSTNLPSLDDESASKHTFSMEKFLLTVAGIVGAVHDVVDVTTFYNALQTKT